MNAADIRNSEFESDNGAWESARWLQEIAAQLAEQNELLERIASAVEGLERK